MNRVEFRERIQQKPLLLDGAMGTKLHAKGVPIDHCFDAINTRNPSMVAEVHRAYIEAGADVIETNTFGANHYRLAEHNLADSVAQINQTAVTIARRVIDGSFKPVLLAGSVGPLGVRLAPLGRVSKEEAIAAFTEQMTALIHAEPRGVDFLILETMMSLAELEAAVTAARSLSKDIPLVASMTFTRDDHTLSGDTPDYTGKRLATLDIDMMGVNCSGGPAQVLRVLSVLHEVAPEMPLFAAPNAGWPQQSEGGRVLYPATPEYFGEYTRTFQAVGARLIGGCCGTTEQHIAVMRHILDTEGPLTRPLPEVHMIVREGEEVETAVTDPPTQLAQFLANHTFVATIEMSPPKGIATQKMLESAHMLKEAGANILNIADNPLARMHMSAWAAAYLVQKKVGLETILHFPTRGRNLLRIHGDLLAAYAMEIRNLFVTMGDPTRIGDYPEAMDSYDIVPTGLLQLIKEQLNRGVDKSGRSIDQATRFTVGCAVNLVPEDAEHEMKLLRKKIRSGADFALTQPIFDPPAARAFIEAYEAKFEEKMIPILAGIKLLYNARNAEFLHNEVPGMVIPEPYLERMRASNEPRKEGVRIAQETLAAVRPFVQGVYFMPAFGRYDLVADVLDILPSLH